MKTYKYKIVPANVIVTLKAKGPNYDGPLEYEGKDFDVKLVKLQLSRGIGAFGHTFSANSSDPIDLDFVLKQTFGQENIEVLGEEVTSYDPGIPEGAVT